MVNSSSSTADSTSLKEITQALRREKIDLEQRIERSERQALTEKKLREQAEKRVEEVEIALKESENTVKILHQSLDETNTRFQEVIKLL